MSYTHVIVEADGGSRGNPGPAAYGALVRDPATGEHPEVRADFLRTLRFWSDRGVDGFRVDVAHALVKNLTEPFPS
ncbi:alpha-amylase family glycosyl hydrolase, partial [Kribbella turkmenica]|uniref:alpha-amylase family glycosyl hydrolase n=1 Tax=Kribbella turkmenica TaxID=2530375 RepID=UPI00192D9521